MLLNPRFYMTLLRTSDILIGILEYKNMHDFVDVLVNIAGPKLLGLLIQ